MISMGTDSLKRVLQEQDELRNGIFLPRPKATPSIGYSLDHPVADLSLGELLNIIDFQIAGHAFVAREPISSVKSKPAKSCELSQSLRDVVDYIVEQRDEAELRRFLQRFPKHQAAAIEAYVAQKIVAS
jgi:hypothetical protein